MNDKIKEILDRLDYNEWEVDLYKVPITWCELYDIRDYITNLQEELEEQKRIEQADFKTIQNIEEENERLNNIINELEKLKDENKILKDALLFIFRDYKVDEIDVEELKRTLKELKGIDKDENN